MTQQGQCFENRLLSAAHSSWHPVLREALRKMDPCFLECLRCCADYWLPGPEKCFAAFEKPKQNVRVVWLGESPYPRRASATGLSFQDGRVDKLFRSDGGLSKNVNKATSLRTILKAWFVATGRLDHQKTNKEHIERMCRKGLICTLPELFERGQDYGWLWLNAGLSLFVTRDKKDKKAQIDKWKPFVEHVLGGLAQEAQPPTCVLLGDFGKSFAEVCGCNVLPADHPMRQRKFIQDANVRDFLFKWRCLIEPDKPLPA